MIRSKESVRFAYLRPCIYNLFEPLDATFREFKADCIITCGTEAHGTDDPHTYGFAIDLRSKHIATNEDKHAILEKIKAACGVLYYVILENEGTDTEHYHLQIRKDLWRNMK
jgi:hypothetical protein